MRQSRKPLMSVPHRRHRDDYSLNMELFDTNDTVMTAFLHSRFNSLITTHCFTSSETPALLGPPRIFHSPIPSDNTTPVSFGLAILPCSLTLRDTGIKTKAEQYLGDKDLRFFTGFGIGKELDITQRIYATKDLCRPDAEGREFKLVNKSALLRKSAVYVVDSDSDDDDEEIEIEMQGLSFEGKEQGEDARIPFTEFGNPCIGERPTGSVQIRTNFNALYKYAFTDDTASFKTATDEDIDNSIDGSVRHLRALLQKRASKGDLGIISLLILRQPAHLYGRLEDFESRIRELLAEDALSVYTIKSLIPASDNSEFLVPPADTAERVPVNLSILNLYEKLLATWVQPLPKNTPGVARLRRERLCRMLATETWLSSIGLHLEPSPESLPPASAPPPPQDASEATGEPPACLPEPLQRIRTYANVSTRITLPEGLQSVLDKWEVGEDPWEYEHVLDEQPGGGGVKKKKSHRRKRGGAVVAAAARGSGVESWRNQIESQPPAIMVNSQPVLRVGSSGPRSSQVEGVVMSQVERGKSGGRPVVVVRKKRKTGF